MDSDIERAGQPIETAAVRRFTLGRVLRIVLVTALALAATAGVLALVPKSYESSAGLLVAAQGEAGAADFDAVMSNRAELITSRELLLEVVDAENLRSVPEFAETGFAPLTLLMRLMGQGGDARSVDETVIANLAERVSVVRGRDSALLSIVARSSDPALSARIANAVARGYVNRRATQALAEAADSSAWLQQEIEKQRDKLGAAERAVADYRSEHGLLLGAQGDSELTTVSTQIAEAQERRNSVEARAKVIRDLIAAGQPLDGVADVQRSGVVQGLLQTKAGLSAELAEKSITLLANHPTIKALRAQIAALESQIATEGAKVAASLDAEAKVEADLEQRLRGELERAKLTAGDAAQSGVTLVGLEREAQAQRDLLDSYLARYADGVSRGGSTAPADVRLVSEAIPASEPASPNVPLTLAAIGLAALVLQVGAAMLSDLSSPRMTVVGEPDRAVDAEPMPRATAADLESTHDARMEWAAQDILFDDDDVEVEVVDIEELDLEAAFEAENALESEEPDLVAAEPAPTPAPVSDELTALAAAVTAHQLRTVLLATVGNGMGVVSVVERLLAETIVADLSAVVVDAGSGEISAAPGLTDLAAGRADYGEVVQRAAENLAEVQWGQLPALDTHSSRPLTLIEALGDIYHVVIVDTGGADAESSLPLFTGARATVVLVAGDDAGPVAIGRARRAIGALGFTLGRVVTLPTEKADVA